MDSPRAPSRLDLAALGDRDALFVYTLTEMILRNCAAPRKPEAFHDGAASGARPRPPAEAPPPAPPA